ncbi:hypothetical protein BDV96DRAFT_641663 [Lophiotrema nucula]|uniref:Uncharacterized protein n=1 Tax=Lophiotrema nucula TaxID=690887 RepID=A0A6A5ZPD3_9PLEO|nr:hypothetical protein BDV96DRAFT_641663 [Lophiotrema nucula]
MAWKEALFEIEPSRMSRWCSATKMFWREVSICFLILLTLFSWTKPWQDGFKGVEINEFGMDVSFNTPSEWKKFTPYHPESERNREVVDAAWKAIIPDHGIVALDRTWAEERGLLRSMYLPSNPQKVLYVLEAYHQLHCVTTTRKAFFSLLNGEPLERDLGHYDHCFDAILQTITCTPSTNLLFTFGHRDINQTQLRQCRSWGALRDWATAHSACDPLDTEGRNDVFHQNFCHGDTDGLYYH